MDETDNEEDNDNELAFPDFDALSDFDALPDLGETDNEEDNEKDNELSSMQMALVDFDDLVDFVEALLPFPYATNGDEADDGGGELHLLSI